MSKIAAAIIIVIICLNLGLAFALGAEVPSNDLIEKANEYNGQEIIYTGEVIGDIMARGDHSWINVFDGSNAIGIWVKNIDMQGIEIAGRYDMHGDTVKITGAFYRACAEHGGDFDIHANKIEVLQKGYTVSHKVEPMKVIISILLFVGAMVCMILIVRKRY